MVRNRGKKHASSLSFKRPLLTEFKWKPWKFKHLVHRERQRRMESRSRGINRMCIQYTNCTPLVSALAFVWLKKTDLLVWKTQGHSSHVFIDFAQCSTDSVIRHENTKWKSSQYSNPRHHSSRPPFCAMTGS